MKNPFPKFWNDLPDIFKNKYAITLVAFFTYLLFFDSNDIPSQIKFKRHLNKLNKQTEYFQKMIEESKSEYASTFSTPEQMETYAREQYMMKKPEEDLFIIEVK